MEINPKEIKGTWDAGYVLDKHTISSTMIGYNEFGHPEFDTHRSALGELIYKLKYKGEKAVLPSIVESVAAFIVTWGINPDVIVPLPPSKQRVFQPVIEIAAQLGAALHVPIDVSSLKKKGITSQMKDVGSYADRIKALEAVFAAGKRIQREKGLVDRRSFSIGGNNECCCAGYP